MVSTLACVVRPQRDEESGFVLQLSPQARALSTAGTADASDDAVELIYDRVLNCYFDPIANKYYELR